MPPPTARSPTFLAWARPWGASAEREGEGEVALLATTESAQPGGRPLTCLTRSAEHLFVFVIVWPGWSDALFWLDWETRCVPPNVHFHLCSRVVTSLFSISLLPRMSQVWWGRLDCRASVWWGRPDCRASLVGTARLPTNFGENGQRARPRGNPWIAPSPDCRATLRDGGGRADSRLLCRFEKDDYAG